jgi:glycine hydroxymethyltransferase
MSTDAARYSRRFREAMSAHEFARSGCISLIAGQNVFSENVGALLSSDLGNRIVERVGDEQLFPGMDNYLSLEALCQDICREQLGAMATEVRPVTGTIANFIIYHALLQPGDLVASLSVSDGAHVSASARTLKHLGFDHFSLPFSPITLSIDVDRTVALILTRRPRLIVLGGSVVLFHEDMRALGEAARAVGAILAYDAAHTIGLILGGQAPNPLADGCDLLTFTTCKTVAGPQHALICGNKEMIKAIDQTSRLWHSGYHLHESAAAVWSIIEALAAGPAYGDALVHNARRLAAALEANGVPILRNDRGAATETYMFLADVREHGGGRICERRLAEAGLLVNRNYLPGAAGQTASDPFGLRFGVAEVTTLGMSTTDMDLIGSLAGTALTSADTSVRGQVAELREAFRRRREAA